MQQLEPVARPPSDRYAFWSFASGTVTVILAAVAAYLGGRSADSSIIILLVIQFVAAFFQLYTSKKSADEAANWQANQQRIHQVVVGAVNYSKNIASDLRADIDTIIYQLPQVVVPRLQEDGVAAFTHQEGDIPAVYRPVYRSIPAALPVAQARQQPPAGDDDNPLTPLISIL